MSIDSKNLPIIGKVSRIFLLFGMAVEATYIFAEAIGGYYSSSYNYFYNTASELMAIGSDDRLLFAPFYFFHSVMIGLFGYGLVVRFQDTRYHLLSGGGLLLVNVGICYALACTIFPMDPPKTPYSLSGYMHIATVSTGVLSLCIAIPVIGKGMSQLMHWEWFKRFSYMVQPIVFIAGLASPLILYYDIALMGLTERLIGHASSIWIFVLAYELLKEYSNNTSNLERDGMTSPSRYDSKETIPKSEHKENPQTNYEKSNVKTNN